MVEAGTMDLDGSRLQSVLQEVSAIISVARGGGDARSICSENGFVLADRAPDRCIRTIRRRLRRVWNGTYREDVGRTDQ